MAFKAFLTSHCVNSLFLWTMNNTARLHQSALKCYLIIEMCASHNIPKCWGSLNSNSDPACLETQWQCLRVGWEYICCARPQAVSIRVVVHVLQGDSDIAHFGINTAFTNSHVIRKCIILVLHINATLWKRNIMSLQIVVWYIWSHIIYISYRSVYGAGRP